MLLQNKVALITGSTTGLGKGFAETFVKEGAKVVINTVHKQDELNEVEKSLKDLGGDVLGILCDVTNKEEVDKMVQAALDKFGKIDILINNAAVLADFKPSLKITEEEWDKVMAVNVKGPYLLTNAVLPHMLKRGEGTIINIASIGGSVAGVGDDAYITSKHAIIGYTKQIAYNYSQYGIRAITLSPGLTATPMVNYVIESGRREAVRQVKNTPTGEIGSVEEVANFAAYLASDKAKRINAGDYKIDGGQHIGADLERDGGVKHY
ncbi:MAG: glucose 1-dehydrogenase [Johnsonella sp.]|nr:glucose 1-dehydrogenase [Johnsonella sp.]